MKPHVLLCLLLLLSGAPAWGQFDQQPLFMQFIDQEGKPVPNQLRAERRRVIYPLWKERYPFVEIPMTSDTIVTRGFVIDTLAFVFDGPVSDFYPSGSLKRVRQYIEGKESGGWIDFYPSGDTSRIYSFKKGKPVSSVCFEPDHTVIHTGFNCEEEPYPLNLDKIMRLIDYPSALEGTGRQGKVILRFLVNTEGIIEKHFLIRTPHPLLSQEVQKYVSQLRFKPLMRHGKPLAAWITIPFDFKITGVR